MINIILKAKHWQLFLITFVIPMIFQLGFMGAFVSSIVTSDAPDPSILLEYFSFFPIIILITASVQFAWFWSVGVGLNKVIPDSLKLKISRFKIAFAIIIIGMVGGMFIMWSLMNDIMVLSQQNFNPALPGILLPLIFLSGFCTIYIYYFVAKTMRTAELQREITVGDYIGEFFLIYFFPIGIWFLQPKINIMIEDKSERNQLIDVL